MFELGNLLSWEYWSEGFLGSNALFYPPSLSISNPNFGLILWVPILLIVIGTCLSIYRAWMSELNPIRNRIPFFSSNLVTLGFFGLTYCFSRMLNFRFLSSRYVMLALIIYFAVLVYYAIRYYVVFFPVEWKYYKKSLQTTK